MKKHQPRTIKKSFEHFQVLVTYFNQQLMIKVTEFDKINYAISSRNWKNQLKQSISYPQNFQKSNIINKYQATFNKKNIPRYCLQCFENIQNVYKTFICQMIKIDKNQKQQNITLTVSFEIKYGKIRVENTNYRLIINKVQYIQQNNYLDVQYFDVLNMGIKMNEQMFSIPIQLNLNSSLQNSQQQAQWQNKQLPRVDQILKIAQKIQNIQVELKQHSLQKQKQKINIVQNQEQKNILSLQNKIKSILQNQSKTIKKRKQKLINLKYFFSKNNKSSFIQARSKILASTQCKIAKGFKVILVQPLNLNCLGNVSPDSNFSINFKIINLKSYIAVGVCQYQAVKSAKFIYFQRSPENHGCYVLDCKGAIWTNFQPQNYPTKQCQKLKFKQKDNIKVTLLLQDKTVRFVKNQQSRQQFKIKINPQVQLKQLCFCVFLRRNGDKVQIFKQKFLEVHKDHKTFESKRMTRSTLQKINKIQKEKVDDKEVNKEIFIKEEDSPQQQVSNWMDNYK